MVAEALLTIGYARMKELRFRKSAIKAEVEKIKNERLKRQPEVIKKVYKAFKPNTHYTTKQVNDLLKPIFKKHNIPHNANGTAQDIFTYFDGECFTGTARARRYELIDANLASEIFCKIRFYMPSQKCFTPKLT